MDDFPYGYADGHHTFHKEDADGESNLALRHNFSFHLIHFSFVLPFQNPVPTCRGRVPVIISGPYPPVSVDSSISTSLSLSMPYFVFGFQASNHINFFYYELGIASKP